MEPQPNDVKAIRVLFFALLAGQLAFALIITALVEAGLLAGGNNEVSNILLVAVVVLAATTVPASFILFRKRLAAINPEDQLGKKLELYRAALIVRMALCEMPALFTIIAYFVTHNHAFLWIIIILIGNFLFIYPTGEKIINQLQLNSKEQSVLGLDQ
jgi:hypothetical protein